MRAEASGHGAARPRARPTRFLAGQAPVGKVSTRRPTSLMSDLDGRHQAETQRDLPMRLDRTG